MASRYAFHVELIDEGVRPWGPGRSILLPGKGRVDHDTFGEVGRAVASVPAEVRVGAGPDRIAKEDLVAGRPAGNGLRIGIEEQLGRIEAVAVVRGIRPVDAIAIALPWPELRHIPVPHRIRAFGQWQAKTLMGTLRGLEETEVDARGMFGEQGKIHPRAIPRGAKR